MEPIKDRDQVIPGKFLGNVDRVEYTPYYFKEGGNLFASTTGMARVNGKNIRVIPSKGRYLPKEEDVIIAVVTEAHSNRWHLDINSPYECIMFERMLLKENERGGRRDYRAPRRDERRIPEKFEVGDILSVKISRVDEVNFCEAIKPWKLERALILEVNPKRVPRVIGKKRSMLNLIKNGTGCKIIVGQNGRIWIKGPNEEFVVSVINKIIREAQSEGLTNRIKKLLEKENEKG